MYNISMNKLIHFTADWCKPCQKMKPIIQDFIVNSPHTEYIQVNIEEDFDTAKQYNIQGIPTLIAIKDGSISGRHTGIADYNKIQSLFN